MNWSYFTDAKFKISGKFKANPEDFIVEEIPLYQPSGLGEHLYVFFEKKGMSTDQLIRKCSQILGVRTQQIGYAGKKDRVGITRQWLSFRNLEKGRLFELQRNPAIQILDMGYHRNKLRPGHLKGNRFHIIIQDTIAEAQAMAEQVLTKLSQSGVPNYFGMQRFGVRGDNPKVGLALLQEDWQKFYQVILGEPSEKDKSVMIHQARSYFDEGEYQKAMQVWPNDQFFPRNALRRLLDADGDFYLASRKLPKNQLKFYLNSLQSYWFNQSLAARLSEMDKIWNGDLAYLHRNGAVFRVEDEITEQKRANQFEISPSGPMWGSKMILPEGREYELEINILKQSGINYDALKKNFQSWHIQGERRPYRIPITNWECEQQGNALHLKFELTAGGYATGVIRELMKDHFVEPQIDV